jgi:hypothetical protein
MRYETRTLFSFLVQELPTVMWSVTRILLSFAGAIPPHPCPLPRRREGEGEEIGWDHEPRVALRSTLGYFLTPVPGSEFQKPLLI